MEIKMAVFYPPPPPPPPPQSPLLPLLLKKINNTLHSKYSSHQYSVNKSRGKLLVAI